MSDHPTWSVSYHRYGMTVSGRVPLKDVVSVVMLARSRGYDLVDPVIAFLLGVTMAFSSATLSDQWRAEIATEMATKGIVDG